MSKKNVVASKIEVVKQARKSRAKKIVVEVASEVAKIEFDATRHANGMILTLARPGVLSTMKSMLFNASVDSPVSKSQILAELVKCFPERDAGKMKSTTMMQVPSGMRVEARIVLRSVKLATSSEHAYYVDVDATQALQASHAASKIKS